MIADIEFEDEEPWRVEVADNSKVEHLIQLSLDHFGITEDVDWYFEALDDEGSWMEVEDDDRLEDISVGRVAKFRLVRG